MSHEDAPDVPDGQDEPDAQIAAVRAAVAAGDPASARLSLHPYLHWTFPDGTTLRGRIHVLAALSALAEVPEPASVELRDGQLYRWVSEE
jgi:hypothetical protein